MLNEYYTMSDMLNEYHTMSDMLNEYYTMRGMRHVDGILQFPPTIKLTATNITEISLKVL
jgi:hypothetical protein